jgi:HK97 family phage major capsid protein
MKTISQYRDDIKALMKRAADIQVKAEAEKRNLTVDEVAAIKDLNSEVKKLSDMVSAMEENESLRIAMEAPSAPMTVEKRLTISQVQNDRSGDRFKSLGEQMLAVVNAGSPERKVDPRLFNAAASGLNETVGSDGGFLVQQDFTNDLLQDLIKTGILAPKCRQQPISGPANGIKINGVDETSRASSRFGGIIGYWASEAEEKTKSKPKFRKIELNLQKLIGLCYATDELLADAAALEGFIRQAFPSEFGFLVDDAIIRGTGAGQPLGILNAGCLVSVAKEAGQAADTIVAENVEKMWSRMFPTSLPRAEWYINQMCYPQLFQMSHSVGTGGIPVFLPPGGLSASPYGQLFGRPVTPIEQCSALGDVGDIIFADMNGYILAQKGGIQSDVSIHVRFIYDESVFRFVLRVDGQPVRASALTPYKGGSGATQSHFITLSERA